MKKPAILGLVVGSLLSLSAQAAVIFEDSFDTEAGGVGQHELNYKGFNQWTVSDGTVDIVSNGGWGIQCVGNAGKCVDLDGSTGNAGTLTSDDITLDVGTYTLSFDISGNQRWGSDNLSVSLDGFFNQSFSLASNSPWQTVTHTFTVATASTDNLIFNNAGGDNIGIMLDNVSLSSVDVPEPSSFALFGLGLIGLGFARRAQK